VAGKLKKQINLRLIKNIFIDTLSPFFYLEI